jgi:hypothetical protein
MREKKVTSLRDDDTLLNPFKLNIPPIDLIFEAPPPATQQMAFDDIITQLIGQLAAAARDRSDPVRPVRILTACHSIASSYTEAGFDIFAEFEEALRTDLHNALRMARRVFLRAGFLLPYPSDQYAAYKQALTETGWRMSDPEAAADYRQAEKEVFHADGRMRSWAVAERKRRSHA